jgi:hypothetical protein
VSPEDESALTRRRAMVFDHFFYEEGRFRHIAQLHGYVDPL